MQAEVTERVRIEHELRESHITFNSLLEAIPEVVYFKDSKGRNILANKAFGDLLNLKKEEIIGKTDQELFPEFLSHIFAESDNEVIRTKNKLKQTINFIDSNGQKKFYESIKVPLISDDGNVEAIVGLSRDITEQKISEESLNISRNELEQTYNFIKNLMELSPIATFSLDKKNRIITLNQKAIDILGYGFDELIGVSFTNLMVKPEKYYQLSSKSVVLEFIAKDGTSIVANVSRSVNKRENLDEITVITLQTLSDLRGIFVDPLQEDLSEEEISSDGKYLELEAGIIYYVDNKITDDTYLMFANMVKSGVPGLCITRQNPSRIRKMFGLLKTPFIWLTKNQENGQPCIDSTELYKLQPTISSFIEKVDNGVVLLDGLEYLSLDNDIKSVIKIIEEVNDSVMNSNSSLVIHFDSLTLEQKDFHLMTRWMKHITAL